MNMLPRNSNVLLVSAHLNALFLVADGNFHGHVVVVVVVVVAFSVSSALCRCVVVSLCRCFVV